MQSSFDKVSDSNSKLIIAIVSALFIAFLIWASSTYLDLVTRGQGRVVVTGQNQSVQVAQKGIITAFHIKVGQTVTAGEVIAEVNPIESVSQLAEIEKRLGTMELRLARLDAELNGETFNMDINGDIVTNNLLRAEIELMDARREDYIARVAAYVEARQQKEQELEAAQAELFGVQQSTILLEIEAKQIIPLVELGALGVSEKFRIEREKNDLETRENILREQILSLKFSISETAAQIIALETSNRNTILQERAETLAQFAELSQRIPALRQRVDQTDIRAPISGTVNQTFFNTPGAVVSEGEIIAEIVPNTGEFRIEALILPEDIANVEPGQKARIALTAYDSARYGTISGRVLRVSADASFQEETQTRMFVVESSLDSSLQDLDGNNVQILPGMVAQVDIIRGQRSILDYFWNPVAKVQDRALRE